MNGNKFETKTMTVTPIMAERWLKRNCVNRNIFHQRVETYAADMKAGNWRFNGEPICFDTEGHLVNGQHRLSAILKANCPIKTLVCFNVKVSDSDIYDRGRGRSTTDSLIMSGMDKYASSHSVVGAVRLILDIEKSNYAPSDTEIQDFILKHHDNLVAAKKLLCSDKHKKKGLNLSPSAMMAATFYAVSAGVPLDVLNGFFSVFYSGFYEDKKQSAAIVLRNDFISKNITIENGRVCRKNVIFSIEKAISDYAAGVSRKRSYAKCNEKIYFITI